MRKAFGANLRDVQSYFRQRTHKLSTQCGSYSNLNRILLVLCMSFAGFACSTEGSKPKVDALYVNGDVYTANLALPNAQAIAVRDGDIVFVGSTLEATAALDARNTFDLGGRFVMPGLIDSHAHPGLVALLGELGETDEGLPMDSKESLFNALKQSAVLLKDEPFLFLDSWDVAMFLPDGPDKADLDAIFPDKPVVVQDNSGHSMWMNSAALTMFGVNNETPDLSPGVSVLVRDESGEPTGWVKEFMLMRQLGKNLLRPPSEIKARMNTYLSYLSAQGVTTLWDAGNFENDNEIYSVLSEMDTEGNLPIRYEGSFHIFDPDQIDIAVGRLLELRKAYSGERLNFNSIKVHYDGVVEIGTAGMLNPFEIGTDNRGGFLFKAKRLSEFLLELDRHDIDLHLHSVGDASTREILDAVQIVRDQGKELRIEVTISHLEHIDEQDFPRFAELGVHANFTPHWWGGTYFGDAGEIYVGEDMIHHSQPGGTLFEHNANVTFSSDVTTMSSMQRSNPFVGMQMALTRQEYDGGPEAALFGTKNNRVNLQQAIAAYTINGARQLGQEHEVGSIEVGKRADFIVLSKSLKDTDKYSIRHIEPDAVLVSGEVVAGSIGG